MISLGNLMNLDTLALQCFLTVAETGSFTEAARRVGRTQSAISQQIAKLEQFLGRTLFHRGRAFALTDDGETFLRYARKIFSLHREVIDHFQEPVLHGEVHFGLPEDFASIYLSDVLAEFARIHPRILLNVECDLTLNLFERFQQKNFDLVLVKMHRPEDVPSGVEVWSEPLDWVGDPSLCGSANPLPLVLSPHPCVYRKRAIEALNEANLSWRLSFSSSSYTSTLAAVRAGMGVTVLPRQMIPLDLDILPPKLLPKLSDTHVSLLKNASDNPVINSFEAFVLQRMRH